MSNNSDKSDSNVNNNDNDNDNANGNNDTNAITVRFNVGGRIYEVSRSLLDLFPNTMLSRMVSDMWQEVQVARNGDGDGDDQNEAAPLIFVDRNGDRFQYVLDYMRDGQKASLPFTVSKEGFLKDLEYYGFDDVDAKSITVEGLSLAVYQKTMERMRKLDYEFKRDYEMARLAHYCFLRFQYTGYLEFCVGNHHEAGTFAKQEHLTYRYNESAVQSDLSSSANFIRSGENFACFNKCLSDYGLKCIKITPTYPSNVTLEIIDGM